MAETIIDGSLDWSGGIDSLKTPTVASQNNPNGLARNQLSWAVNSVVRDGGISQRWGSKLKGTVADGTALFQGKFMYRPDSGTPYIIALIGGHVWRVDPDFVAPPLDLSQVFAEYLPASQPKAFFEQAENYLVIQAGDNVTLPLIWDGTNLFQSNGITGVRVVGQPTARVYSGIQMTGSWQVPAIPTNPPLVVAAAAVMQLTAPYPGNLGDNVVIYDSNATPRSLGTYRVTGVFGNNIYLTLFAIGNAAYSTGTVITNAVGPFTFILTLPVINATNNYTSIPVAIGVGNWTVPPLNKTTTIDLAVPYPGSVGDTISIYDLSSNLIGNFIVTKIGVASNGDESLTVKTTTGTPSGNIGKKYTQATFNVTVTGIRNFSFTEDMDVGFPVTIPDVGQTFNIIFPRDQYSYTGNLFDLVNLSHNGVLVGTFKVVGINAIPNNFRYDVTLSTIGLNVAVGTRYSSGNFNFRIVAPNPSTFPIELGGGTWTVPAVGQTVALDIFWNFPNGPAPYPGNVGDNVTLWSNSSPGLIGTFLVNGFGADGSISLQVVSSPLSLPAVFTGLVVGTMTINTAPSDTGYAINQIPAATMMKYYMGRLWYVQGNKFFAGDIVGGPSGTAPNNYRDSVLAVTENPLCFGGDGFSLPISDGPITGLAVSSNIDAALGQGLLYVGTNKSVSAVQVPVTRADWIAASSNNQPQIVVVQLVNGWVSDRAIVPVNGDLYFQDNTPAIRSLITAMRYFSQPGNVAISSDIDRLLEFNDRTLMSYATGIEFDNYLLMGMLPMQTQQGVVHQAIVPLDFAPLSTLEGQLPQCWQGHWQGLQVLQMTTGNFNGVDRAFAMTVSTAAATLGQIQLWELTTDQTLDGVDLPGVPEAIKTRVQWQSEFPAWTGGDEMALKKLVSGEMWVDSVTGTVEFLLEWRPDSQTCWQKWAAWSLCSPRNTCEDVTNPVCYPVTPYGPGFKQTMTFPKPPESCQAFTGRPAYIGYQFQPRLTIKGYCRIRGLWLHMEPVDRKLYDNMIQPVA